MTRTLILVPLLVLCQSAALTQNAAPFSHEQWEANPTLHPVRPAFKDASAIVISEKTRVEYVDEKDGSVTEYYTRHNIVRVNDEKGIESYNKIYLGASNSLEIADIRARTILPGGRVVEIDKSNIKDLKEENGSVYKIFAMEGLEKGCELEFMYTSKKESSFFGRIYIQGGSPIEQSELEIIAPERLVFEIKPYNFSTPVTDTVLNEKRILRAASSGIPALEEEKYASYEVNLRRLEYKLSYNNATHKGERLFTWNEMAKRIFGNYASFKDKELSKVDGFIHSQGWDKLTTLVDKITAVENQLKKNFTTREEIDGEGSADIEAILKNKIASYQGIIRLYGAIYHQLGVNYQVVFVCDRDNYIIDRDFENWNNCEVPILYFPSTGKFLAPTRLEFRYPYIFPAWAGANGFFAKITSIGNFTTAIGEVKPVPMEDYTQTFNNMESKAELNTSLDTLIVDMRQIYGGYEAAFYRAGFNFASAEEQRSFLKQMVKFGTNSENILSSETLNPEMENAASNKPFIMHAKVKASELLENAGNKLLVKIGELIGPQVEMYQEKPRQLPIKNEYPHVEERKIEFIIPAGYRVKNAEDLKLEHVYKENGETTMGFTSTYTLTGNILSIHIMEQYHKIFYPLQQWDEFRRIINTSADFNKIVLVLEKVQ